MTIMFFLLFYWRQFIFKCLFLFSVSNTENLVPISNYIPLNPRRKRQPGAPLWARHDLHFSILIWIQGIWLNHRGNRHCRCHFFATWPKCCSDYNLFLFNNHIGNSDLALFTVFVRRCFSYGINVLRFYGPKIVLANGKNFVYGRMQDA